MFQEQMMSNQPNYLFYYMEQTLAIKMVLTY